LVAEEKEDAEEGFELVEEEVVVSCLTSFVVDIRERLIKQGVGERAVEPRRELEVRELQRKELGRIQCFLFKNQQAVMCRLRALRRISLFV
jgi:hypothetical protein